MSTEKGFLGIYCIYPQLEKGKNISFSRLMIYILYRKQLILSQEENKQTFFHNKIQVISLSSPTP